MEKAGFLTILVILATSFVGLYLLGPSITGMFIGYGQPTDAVWWNTSWNYRIRLDINSTQYSRTEWPVEQEINFTDMLPSGTFDINSMRIIEYSQSGSVIQEVPSQFDQGEGYDASNNALGTAVFLMNGSTSANANRTFYVYYDTVENGAKSTTSYPTNLTYSWDGQIANVNTSLLRLYIDTNRIQNTSGLYRVGDIYDNFIIVAGINERTVEYNEYYNNTHNVSFDLIGNASFANNSIRITIEQVGGEIIFGNPGQQTNEASIKKRYYIYNRIGPEEYGSFIKIEQTVTNSAGYQIQRNSTASGALAFDLERALNSPGGIEEQDADPVNPYSWAWGSGIGGEMVGLLNLEQNGTSNYYASNNSFTPYGRIGIQLDTTNIPSGSSIRQLSLIYFSGTGGSFATTEFSDIKDRFETPITVYQHLPETWYVIIEPATNSSIYNRNETVLIIGNVSDGDPYNLTQYMNATFDMGTGDTGDDQTIFLYDDGLHEDGASDDKAFANVFGIANNANVSVWTVNITTYSNTSEFLNSTIYTFNVTDVFNVTVNITNKKPQVGQTVFANIYVKNYNQSENIVGATINCSYDSIEVTNKEDHNNGTYSVNFTAPVVEGTYTLYCNATKNGNFGNNSDSFDAEAGKTNVSIDSVPSDVTVSNITLYSNESFSITINATNTQNATAYDSNISLEITSGWVADSVIKSCGDIEKVSFCNRTFNITVPNATTPGNYYVNATVEWGNPDSTTGNNTTTVNVTVSPNPLINVSEEQIANVVGDGSKIYIGNFTVLSIGNSPIQNINFTCYSGDVCNNFTLNFTPTSISSIGMGNNSSVAVNVSVPLGYPVGTYSGTVNVSAENDGYSNLTLNITVPTKTNVSVVSEPDSYTASNITQQNNESFLVNITITNIGKGSAKYSNISLSIPSVLSSNSSLEICNNVTKDETCIKAFNITVLNGTNPGSHYVNITANWTNPDGTLGTNTTYLNVTVEPNPLINVSETVLSQSVPDATTAYVGNFTILSIGIGALQNISFNCYEGTVCDNFTASFTPQNISSLDMNENYSVAVNVSVPLGYPVGTYSGTVNVSAENDGYSNLTLNITVPSNRTWTMSPTSCGRSETPDEGTVCEVTVYNLGNDVINFTISPQSDNNTEVNVTSFYASGWTNYTFNTTYNITDAGQGIYNTLFVVDANQSNSNPSNMTLNITLYPYLPPIINFTITPNSTEQNSSVLVFANITDISNTGLKWVNITVTTANGTSNQTNMTLVNSSGNFSQWNFTYPDGYGDTLLRGDYTVIVSAEDNIGNYGNLRKNFTVYINLVVTSATLSGTYLQGDTGSIYYTAKNLSGAGIGDVNVTFTLRDATNNISHYTVQQTSSDGSIYPLPTFTLPSDAITGNYTLFSNSTYYDSVSNVSVEVQKNSTFEVDERTITVSGLFADIETVVAWYPDNQMRFAILVYNGEGMPVDPDDMILTVYRPDDLVYFSYSMGNMTRESTGYYIFDYQMATGTPTGMFLAVLNVTKEDYTTAKIKAFRVTQGGPYDVRLIPFENEVPRGDYFDYAIVIENKGAVTQDVFVEYNVTDLNGTSYFYYNGILYHYYYSSEAVLTPAYTNQSFTRQAYILSNQPLGTYILNARVAYDYVQPVINANTTFTVIEAITPPTTPPAPTPTPTGDNIIYVKEPAEQVEASILITGFDNNISLARGITKIENVVVKNNGRVNLKNMSLFLLGIPTEWFSITPEKYSSVTPDNSSVFLIEFNVPESANIGDYRANLLAVAGVISDQKTINIMVFSSIKELLESEIERLEEELINLKVDIKLAEREGKGVSNILTIVDTIESYIKNAKDDIKSNNLEDAMEKVSSAVTLIRKAKDLLDTLEIFGPAPLISIWVLMILLIVIIIIVFVVVYLWRKKKLKPMIRPYIIQISRLVERSKGKEVDKGKLEAEKEKMVRMLKVLEREKKEGLITNNAYSKMKKSLEKKLNEIDKKIK